MVLMLFTLGSYLEAAARARAARDLEPLLAAEREQATIVEAGMETRRSVGLVEAGMLVRIRPGERIPVDGVVVEGQSHNDEAVITGESRHIAKGVGSTVIAGSINLDGPLLVRGQWCRGRDPMGRDLPVGAGGAVAPQPDSAHCRYRRWSLCAAGPRPRRVDGSLLDAVIAF